VKTKYKTCRPNIVEALDEIDRFLEKMEMFMEQHQNYAYEINICKRDDGWWIFLTVNKDEEE